MLDTRWSMGVQHKLVESMRRCRPDAAARRLYLRPRMKLAMHSLQPLLIDMGVDLRRRYVGVAQHLLDDSQICAVAEQVRCEAVPQKVRINVLLQSSPPRVLFNDLPYARCG